MIKKIVFSISLFAIFSAFAQAADMSSPVGIWQTISDQTKQPSSLVKISKANGVLIGEVLQLLPGSQQQESALCFDCPEGFKNKPIIGLHFLWDFVPDQKSSWKNGKILDPLSGHIYKGTLKLVDQGRKMELRGYWGPFWRTQTWLRA